MEINDLGEKYKGLTIKEIRNSIKEYGVNSLGSAKKESIFKKILNTFKEPMFILLIASSFVYLILGDISDSLIMLFFVLVIVSISFYQEYKTDKALDALKTLTSPRSKVIRDSILKEIKSEEVVVGDIMILHEGDLINAEGDILECRDFSVNESSLTGESFAVWKKAKLNNDEKDDHFKKNRCYAGTNVTSGFAVVLVTNVGISTEYGKIGESLNNIEDSKTPLEKQIKSLIKVCATISLILLILVGSVTFLKNSMLSMTLFGKITDSIIAGITIAMATIPEELPVVLTVFLTMGAYIISKQKSLIRKISAVETLGAISVLCVDKTGTLTENRMSVSKSFTLNDNINKLLDVSILTCEPESYDQMEKAIIENYKNQKNIDRVKIPNPIYEYSFTSETKIMGHVFEDGENYSICVKGAYEKVLPLCKLSEEEHKILKKQISEFSSQGSRILAFAIGKNSEIKESLNETEFEFVGIYAFADPVREGIDHSVKKCYEAGIKLVMITGDNGDTARAIAKSIGIRNCEEIITGDELEKMSDDELYKKVKNIDIFARVYPNHKMRIVEAFQKHGDIVAMTGDGVNDATALKKADVGIAMGQRGTEVAKQASKIILLDDNFKTIVNSIENGRRVYDNIKKAVKYILVIHIPIALIALLVPMFDLPILLLPIHVVLLELIIDPTSSIIFERCRAEKNIMKRPPRNIKESLLSKKYVLLSIIQGLIIFASFFGSYLYMINNNYSKEVSTTFALVVLILSNLFLVYTNMSEFDLAFKNFIKSLKDKIVTIINLSILFILFIVVYMPFAQKIVGTSNLNLTQLLMALLISSISVFWFDIYKLINLKIKKRSN